MINILTVGDGDLTFSLALARAYGENIQMTASVLDSKEEILQAFPDAPIRELETFNIPILFEVDATQLHKRYPPNSFDLILFHHPHLGLASLEDNETEHANRHHVLLCHYLYAAKLVAPMVHICLCGSQSETWGLLDAATKQGLELTKTLSTAPPFSQVWANEDRETALEAAPPQPQFAAPRRYRNGKLGSRHFLGRYGYRHRRTEGVQYKGINSDSNVTGSMHYVFKARTHSDALSAAPTLEYGDLDCRVCSASFQSLEALRKHAATPALPRVDFTTVSKSSSKTQASDYKPSNKKTPSLQKEYPTGNASRMCVTEQYDGKRLRWFLHHHVDGLSKKQSELSVKCGIVIVNGIVVKDSSRILHAGDEISILKEDVQASSEDAVEVEILHRQPNTLVVWKPSGIRTKGKFSGTLENRLSHQEGASYTCASRLDTSCPGICVMISNRQVSMPIHTLSVLVHGTVPDGWFPSTEINMEFQPKWNSKRKRIGDEDAAPDATNIATERVQVVPLERSTSEPRLSSIEIICENPSSSSICCYFRQVGFPVVGDQNCSTEYLSLNRSIRNRIKGKLCIGCYKVTLEDGTTIQKNTPDKLSANHWTMHTLRKNSEAAKPSSSG